MQLFRCRPFDDACPMKLIVSGLDESRFAMNFTTGNLGLV